MTVPTLSPVKPNPGSFSEKLHRRTGLARQGNAFFPEFAEITT